MVASFIVWREGNEYLLALSRDLVEPIAKRLQMYVLRAKVSIQVPGDSLLLLGVAGPQAGMPLRLHALPFPNP